MKMQVALQVSIVLAAFIVYAAPIPRNAVVDVQMRSIDTSAEPQEITRRGFTEDDEGSTSSGHSRSWSTSSSGSSSSSWSLSSSGSSSRSAPNSAARSPRSSSKPRSNSITIREPTTLSRFGDVHELSKLDRSASDSTGVKVKGKGKSTRVVSSLEYASLEQDLQRQLAQQRSSKSTPRKKLLSPSSRSLSHQDSSLSTPRWLDHLAELPAGSSPAVHDNVITTYKGTDVEDVRKATLDAKLIHDNPLMVLKSESKGGLIYQDVGHWDDLSALDKDRVPRPASKPLSLDGFDTMRDFTRGLVKFLR